MSKTIEGLVVFVGPGAVYLTEDVQALHDPTNYGKGLAVYFTRGQNSYPSIQYGDKPGSTIGRLYPVRLSEIDWSAYEEDTPLKQPVPLIVKGEIDGIGVGGVFVPYRDRSYQLSVYSNGFGNLYTVRLMDGIFYGANENGETIKKILHGQDHLNLDNAIVYVVSVGEEPVVLVDDEEDANHGRGREGFASMVRRFFGSFL